jgi:hypothetical protein
MITSLTPLLSAAKAALADLEGIMPEYEPSGERTHPAWVTIAELESAIALVEAEAVRQPTSLTAT